MSKSCLQKLWKENTWNVTRLVSESFVIGEPAYYIVDCRIHVLSNAVDCDSKLILYCRLVAEQIFCITEHWVPTSNTYRSTTYREFCITKGKWTFNSLSAGCRFHKKKSFTRKYGGLPARYFFAFGPLLAPRKKFTLRSQVVLLTLVASFSKASVPRPNYCRQRIFPSKVGIIYLLLATNRTSFFLV